MSVVHSFTSSQSIGLLPVQTPAWQVLVWVQTLWSSHDVPSGLAGLVQAPVDGLQTPAVWHWSLAVQALMQCPPHSICPGGQVAQR
jgi:hypothetical protein